MLPVTLNASVRRTVGAGAVLAAGLMSPLAWSAPGDLDPAFGNLGHVGPMIELQGAMWAIEPQDDDRFLFGGGDFVQYCDDDCNDIEDLRLSASGFTKLMSATGSIDPSLSLAALDGVQVVDIARQADGKTVGVGRQVQDNRSVLSVFRLEPNGTLDVTFGDAGIVRYAPGDRQHAARAVTIDPGGRIVVAGTRDVELIVLALDTKGAVDAGFADAGLYVGPRVRDVHPPLLRTASGGYRISTTYAPDIEFPRALGCQVMGLTVNGELDAAFGVAGKAIVGPPIPIFTSARCGSIVGQDDGGLIVVGSEHGHGFAIRLLADGVRDVEFLADAVAQAMTEASAIAVGADGSIVVAGRSSGMNGAIVVRLQASGELDSMFGSGGASWLDLPADFGSAPVVHDIELLPDGAALLAGGEEGAGETRPFVARLLGDSQSGPGIIGVMTSSVAATEDNGEAIVIVRRTGGTAGAVGIFYDTNPGGASAGDDYIAIEGELQWADGDAGDREIVVPIVADSAHELSERFSVVLSSPQGGAGLGSSAAVVEIAADVDQGTVTDNDPPTDPGGGGEFGWLSLLLLGTTGLGRRQTRAHDPETATPAERMLDPRRHRAYP